MLLSEVLGSSMIRPTQAWPGIIKGACLCASVPAEMPQSSESPPPLPAQPPSCLHLQEGFPASPRRPSTPNLLAPLNTAPSMFPSSRPHTPGQNSSTGGRPPTPTLWESGSPHMSSSEPSIQSGKESHCCLMRTHWPLAHRNWLGRQTAVRSGSCIQRSWQA